MEARIGAEGIELGVDFEEDDGVGAVFYGAFEIVEGLVVFVEAGVDESDVEGGDVFRFGEVGHFGKDLFGGGAIAGSGVGVAECSEHGRAVVRDGGGFL